LGFGALVNLIQLKNNSRTKKEGESLCDPLFLPQFDDVEF